MIINEYRDDRVNTVAVMQILQYHLLQTCTEEDLDAQVPRIAKFNLKGPTRDMIVELFKARREELREIAAEKEAASLSRQETPDDTGVVS